jgi:hypothetical protein
VDGTGSGSCPEAGTGVSGFERYGNATKEVNRSLAMCVPEDKSMFSAPSVVQFHCPTYRRVALCKLCAACEFLRLVKAYRIILYNCGII